MRRVEHCDPHMQAVEVSLEDWHQEVERYAHAEQERAIFWAAWAFRLQGFVVGLLIAAMVAWLLYE